MKTLIRWFVLAFIGAFLAGLIVGSHDVLASEKIWRGTVNNVSIIAYKSVNLGGYVWTTTLSSDAAQDINIIGYTYWTVGEYCTKTKTWAYWQQFRGDYNTNSSSYYSSANIAYRGGCNGTSRYWSKGNHDFAYGQEHKYPSVATYESK